MIPMETTIEKIYGINRSFRRGYETCAIEEVVSGPGIDLINRWRTIERNKEQ